MRLIGIVAVFVLSLVAIVEGAVLFRLSGRIDGLTAELQAAREGGEGDGLPARTTASGAVLTRPVTLTRSAGAPPAFNTAAAGSSAPAGPAVDVLAEALSTSAGRDQLRGALAKMKDEDRRDRMIKNAPRQEERDTRERDRILRFAGLQPHEQQRVGQLFTDLQQNRRRVMEELQAGLKTAEQADDEIDDMEDATEKAWKTLLGDQRMKQFRDAEKAERNKEREKKKAAEAQAKAQAQGQPGPVVVGPQ